MPVCRSAFNDRATGLQKAFFSASSIMLMPMRLSRAAGLVNSALT